MRAFLHDALRGVEDKVLGKKRRLRMCTQAGAQPVFIPRSLSQACSITQETSTREHLPHESQNSLESNSVELPSLS